MDKLLYVLGVGMLLFGIVVLMGAKGGIHEVFAAVLFGFGTVSLGLAAIISRLDDR